MRGGAGGVAAQQRGQRSVGVAGGCGDEWDGQGGCAVVGVQGGAEDGDHGTGRGVHDGASGGLAGAPQRFAAVGADGQLQGAVHGVVAVRRRIGGPCRAEDSGLAQAVGVDPYVRARGGGGTGGDGERGDGEPFGADEGEGLAGQRGDGGQLGRVCGAAGDLDDDPFQAVHRLVAGDDRAEVVGDEAGAARPARLVTEPYQ
ncbi:hypothetical protein [Streptomyces sp. CC228A]|uniref:hypothetical protein n=1 Tax=Streptomyces sp. CC228A TaxID=2898186 RepID=UPI001F3C3C73|nr:hypothetical protein [Streptomyces sp. CC228A]